MVSKDIDRAIDRFLSASRRIRNGLTTQRARIMQSAADAPKQFEGESYEYADLSATFENDLDYYIYEMGRLRDMAEEMDKPFGHPQEIKDALAAFDEIVPELKKHRNARTHPSDDARLDDVVSLSAAVRLKPVYRGGVTYLVDPRYQHHDAALELLTAIETYLREHLQKRRAEDPPVSIDQQIARRNAQHQ
jgi:hypothetical protein